MARVHEKLVIAAFIAIMLAPLAAKRLGIADLPVYGALPPAPPRPQLTWSGLRDESYQTTYTAWFERHLGLRGYSTFVDNTVLYHVLDDTKPTAGIVVGDDDVLFLGDDLVYFNSTADAVAPGRIARLATTIAEIQTRLAAEHRALVPIIVPSKTSIYPDKVPAGWTRDLGSPRPTDDVVYHALRAALDARHVIYVDARDLLASSREPRAMLWPTTGRHWSQFGACLVLAEVGHRFTALTGRPLDLACTPRLVETSKDHDDLDLALLLDAWWLSGPDQAIETEPQPARSGPRPSLMLAGTSFCWNLMRVALRSHQVDASLNYYDATLYLGASLAKSDLHATPTAWLDAVRGKDLYVIDLFEPYIGPPDSTIEQFPTELARELDKL